MAKVKPGPRMSRRQSRERAERALIARARGATFQEIATAYGFSSRASAERAVSRELQRTSPDSPSTARRYLLESARATSRRWDEEFEKAYAAGDIEAMAESHRALCRDRDATAKLTGAYAPADVRVGVTAEQFAAQAAELAKAFGVGPLLELAGSAPALPAPVYEYDPDWSNLTGPADTSGVSTLPGPEGGSAADTAPVTPVVRRDREDDEDYDDEDGPEQFEDLVVVEAELVDEVVEQVALPPGQRRIPAAEALDADGVPHGRAGRARSLGGYGGDRPRLRKYDPLAGALLGRSPALSEPDPMPSRMPPTRG